MAGGMSQYMSRSVLDHYLRNQAYTPAAAIYVALLTTMPSDDAGTGLVEVAGPYATTGYQRMPVTYGAATGTSPAQVANTAAVTFDVAATDWTTVVGYALYDAATAGNLLGFVAISPTIPINIGSQLTFPCTPVAALTFTLD